MSVRMKALRSWHNKQHEGQVEADDEITVDEARAKELEMAGLAVRLGAGGKQLTKDKAEKSTGTVSLNRPDEGSRPLTGTAKAPSSSQADRAQSKKSSRKSAAKRK